MGDSTKGPGVQECLALVSGLHVCGLVVAFLPGTKCQNTRPVHAQFQYHKVLAVFRASSYSLHWIFCHRYVAVHRTASLKLVPFVTLPVYPSQTAKLKTKTHPEIPFKIQNLQSSRVPPNIATCNSGRCILPQLALSHYVRRCRITMSHYETEGQISRHAGIWRVVNLSNIIPLQMILILLPNAKKPLLAPCRACVGLVSCPKFLPHFAVLFNLQSLPSLIGIM